MRDICKTKGHWISDLAFIEGSEMSLEIWNHLPKLQIEEKEWEEVLRSVEAWIIFGGYGRRTRKGMGSLLLKNSKGYEGILSKINWDDVDNMKIRITEFLKNLYNKEKNNKGGFSKILNATDPWKYQHPVLSKYSIIAVGSTNEREYTKAIGFIQKRVINGGILRKYAGNRGGKDWRDPSQIFISLKRSNGENYNFVLLFAPRGGLKNYDKAKEGLIRNLRSIGASIIFPSDAEVI